MWNYRTANSCGELVGFKKTTISSTAYEISQLRTNW